MGDGSEARARPQGVVVVVRRAGRYLLIERGPVESFAGHWCPVGGQVEAGETHHAAVVREFREEVGAEVRPLRKLGEGRSRSGTFDLHYYEAELLSGEPHAASPEVADLAWLLPDEIAALPRCFPEDLRLIARIEAERGGDG